MATPLVYADFHNADAHGRLRLNCAGTLEDLALQKVELREGLMVTLYADDLDDAGRLDELRVDGIVSFSGEEQLWVATIDWSEVRHASDGSALLTNGSPACAPITAPSHPPAPRVQ